MSVSRETVTGPKVVKGGLRLTPRARVMTVRLPRGALVWSRPLDVLVHEDDRLEVRRVKFPDVTRTAQVVLCSCVAATLIALQLLAIRKRRTAS